MHQWVEVPLLNVLAGSGRLKRCRDAVLDLDVAGQTRATRLMTLSDFITRTPLAFDPSTGDERVAQLGISSGLVADLVHGAAGSSPYLSGLIWRERAWLSAALAQDPGQVTAELLTQITSISTPDLKPKLRCLKRRTALWTALMDLGGVWCVLDVTKALTLFAQQALDHTLHCLVSAEALKGKIPNVMPGDPTCGGMVVLAMGKMGAYELNYSSDIDLICLFDQDRFDSSDYGEARAAFIKITRRAMAVMSDITGDGYVFRTDLRLRPDPSVTPVCIALEAAERYYESVGRGWERAAYIKARPCAGDQAAGAAFLRRLDPFIWRKHLDYVALRDTDETRQRIRAHKGLTGTFSLPGHNIKLGAGGIREIEFYTQTHQMILGGRAPALRLRGTVDALSALAKDGRIEPDAAAELADHYHEHRRVEHAIQMINDAQTHDSPRDSEGMKRISYLLGEGDVARFADTLTARLRAVTRVTDPFFEPPSSAKPAVRSAPIPAETKAILDRWLHYPALRSSRAVEIFERLRPELLVRLERAAKPNEALIQFDGFLSGLPAGVQLFALFEANPQLIDLIVDICATSPALARYLSRNAAVFDAVIGGPFFAPWPGPEALATDLGVQLAASRDYEHSLETLRRWKKEWHFRIGVHLLRGLISASEAAAHYADLADTVVRGVLPLVQSDMDRRHGKIPGGQVAVVGMGSLGAQALHAGSDLDLIVVYHAPDGAVSAGARSLDPRSYYAKLTKTFVTALGAPMSEGIAYEVDMRLRPSGKQGPVATSLTAYAQYQRDEAWTWEHLALTRARCLAGDAALQTKIDQVRLDVLSSPRDRAQIVADWAEMRTRLFAAKSGDRVWDLKDGPGSMMDIELMGQTAALITGQSARTTLAQLELASGAGLSVCAEIETLISQYQRLVMVLHAARLLTDGPLDPGAVGEGGRAFLLRDSGHGTIADLERALRSGAQQAARVISRACHEPNHGKPETRQEADK